MAKIYEDKAFVEKLDRWIESKRADIVGDLKKLVAQKSLRTDPIPECMFGEDTYKCLQLGKSIAEERGFKAEFCDDNKYVLAHYGEGDKLISFLSHLDVVPEGNGWLGDPFVPLEKDGLLIGRGVEDNKKAMVQGLYTMMALRDLEVPFSSRIELFMGGSEETGMEDAEAYALRDPKPDFAIVSDSSFPYCQCETNGMGFDAVAPQPFVKIADLYAGEASNVVPDRAKAVLNVCEKMEAKLREAAGERITVERQGDQVILTAYGAGAHASSPEAGVNAIWLIADLISRMEDFPEPDRTIMAQTAKLLGDCYGEGLGIAYEDAQSGKLHCISGKSRVVDGKLHLNFDCRACITSTEEGLAEQLGKTFGAIGWAWSHKKMFYGYYIEPDDKRAQLLLEMYKNVIGRDDKPFQTGGGTYVRKMGGCAMVFGGNIPGETFPELPEGHGHAHQANEAVRIETLLRVIKLYVLTMIELDRMLHE